MVNQSERDVLINIPLFAFLCLSICFLFALQACEQSVTENNYMLFDFETNEELDLFAWKCRSQFSLSENYKKHGQRSLRMEFYPTRRVGFSTRNIEHNWSKVKAFELTVYNPSMRTVSIYLQISDDSSKGNPLRTSRKLFTTLPGENIFRVSISQLFDSTSRKLNPNYIQGFYIYMTEITSLTTLYFDYFRLI